MFLSTIVIFSGFEKAGMIKKYKMKNLGRTLFNSFYLLLMENTMIII